MTPNLQKIKYFFYLLFFYFSCFKYLSFKKILNIFKLKVSYYTSVKKLNFYKNIKPFFISVEPSNYCQLQCPECPVGLRYYTQNKRNLIPKTLVKQIVDELKDSLIHVIFYFQGEPFLNNDIFKDINYAHQAKIFTSTSTNAQALSESVAKNIVESGLDKIIISIDGATQDVYEKYRVGGKLSKAIEGINYLRYWKQKLQSQTPFIEIQFIVFKTNEHQISAIYKLAKDLKVNNLALKTAQLYSFENGHNMLTTIDKYARYKKIENGTYKIKSKLPNHCWRMWSGGVVNANGDLVPCCFDKNSDHSYGNVQANSFLTIWHNDKSNNFRNKILTNRKQFEMCKNCTSV